jgi:two-component system, NarL family, nitrate/nitrite response regulator NarL
VSAVLPIRVLVVDDHTLFRRGVTALLGADARFSVVGQASDAGEAYRHAASLQPDVILLDNHLPGVNGVDALSGLLEVAPQAKVLMLTVSESEHDLAAALRCGARGYLLKTVDSDVLAQSIVRTAAGDSVVSPEMTGKLVNAFQSLPDDASRQSPGPQASADPIHSLSPREQEILAGIARGQSNKEIARTLSIAETTVKIHVQHILRKLNLVSRVQAAVYAAQRMPRPQ